jgi:hypothetical protein
MTDEVAPRPRGNAELSAWAKANGYTMGELHVLAPSNDPFNKGTETDQLMGRWFADLHGGTNVVHLRRLHYVAVSTEVELPDGSTYDNTEKAWQTLVKAAATARALGLVDPALIVDARNPEATINFPHRPAPLPGAGFELLDVNWTVPTLNFRSAWMSFPEPIVYGYEWEPGDEPVHVEVWVEKTTMDDVLRPLCQRYNVNYQSGPGFSSITRIVDLIHRAARDRPVRVLYVSDYDPAGVHMPKSVARQIEFYADEGLDIALTPLVLISAQVAEYDLPRTPIKESDRRRGKFEAANGRGAVELDALEALHPGVLAEIVRDAIAEHRDRDYRSELYEAEADAEQATNDEWLAMTADEQDRLAAIEAQVNEVVDRYRDEINDLTERIGTDLAGPTDDLAQLAERVDDLQRAFDVELPDRPVAYVDSDADDWLYHSHRHWLDQLDAYREWTP